MLIGCGRHATRTYLPVLCDVGIGLRSIVVVDLAERLPEIRSSLADRFGHLAARAAYVSVTGRDARLMSESLVLPPGIAEALDEARRQHCIDRVLICTAPDSHLAYADWALRRYLHILMEKPISAPMHLRTSVQAVDRLWSDYAYLHRLLIAQRRAQPDLVFNIMTQRRYHVGFQAVLGHIQQIADDHGVGVTAFQSLHSDGQWRPPFEMITQDYHGYNSGHGKGLHSGYHAIDVTDRIVQLSQSHRLEPEVHANFVYPGDYLAAFAVRDQYGMLGQEVSEAEAERAEEELAGAQGVRYGEISGHLSVAYRNPRGRKTSAGTVALLHDGVSQRGWARAHKEDLYQNGRVRQESHYYASGPLQVIQVSANEGRERRQGNIPGDENSYDFVIDVYRNAAAMRGELPYQRLGIGQLYRDRGLVMGDPMKDARRYGLLDFFNCIGSGRTSSTSDYTSHESTVRILAKMYESALRQSDHSQYHRFDTAVAVPLPHSAP
jgi:hypothetical protein